MFKLVQLYCKKCDKEYEDYLNEQDDHNMKCKQCGGSTKIIPSFAGYRVSGDNSASTRPKNAGAFRRKV